MAQPLPKQGHSQQGVQGHLQVASKDLQGEDSTATGQPVPLFTYPHSTEVLQGVQGKLSCESFFPGLAQTPENESIYLEIDIVSSCILCIGF